MSTPGASLSRGTPSWAADGDVLGGHGPRRDGSTPDDHPDCFFLRPDEAVRPPAARQAPVGGSTTPEFRSDALPPQYGDPALFTW